MDHTFARRFTTALSGSTIAVGVLAGTLILDTPAAADTMGISVAASGTASPGDLDPRHHLIRTGAHTMNRSTRTRVRLATFLAAPVAACGIFTGAFLLGSNRHTTSPTTAPVTPHRSAWSTPRAKASSTSTTAATSTHRARQ